MPNAKEKVKAWLCATETPRWWILLVALIGVAGPLVSTSLVQDRARRNDRRAADITALTESMVQFQSFAAAFATEMFSDGQVAAATRGRLVENINVQFAKARSIEGALQLKQPLDLREYMNSLLQMRTAVDQTTDIASMKGFWSSVSQVTILRNRLGAQLRDSI